MNTAYDFNPQLQTWWQFPELNRSYRQSNLTPLTLQTGNQRLPPRFPLFRSPPALPLPPLGRCAWPWRWRVNVSAPIYPNEVFIGSGCATPLLRSAFGLRSSRRFWFLPPKLVPEPALVLPPKLFVRWTRPLPAFPALPRLLLDLPPFALLPWLKTFAP